MSGNGLITWASLERWRAKLFLLAAVMLAINAVILFYDVIAGTELRLPLGQVFVGTGWTAALLGMLGLYRPLQEHRPWLARICALAAVIGVYGYAVMGVAFAAAVGGLPMDTVESYQIVFLPAVLVGTLLAFPLFAIAGLLTGAYSRTVSVLLAASPVIFVINVLTGPNPESIFGVLVALTVVYGTLGYLLPKDDISSERVDTPTDPSV